MTEIIKLASNENPWAQLLIMQMYPAKLNYTPDYNTHPFIGELASHLNISKRQLILGNGSDEILQIIALALISPGDEILSSSCTFSEYRFVAQITGATYVEATMENYTYNVDHLINAITPKTKIIFIANPNNPTGTMVPHSDIKRLLDATNKNTLVVLDEAYAEYVTDPNYPKSELINDYPNLLDYKNIFKILWLGRFTHWLRNGTGTNH